MGPPPVPPLTGTAPVPAPLCFPSRGRGSGEGPGRGCLPGRREEEGGSEGARRSWRPLGCWARPVKPPGCGGDLLFFPFLGERGKSREGCSIPPDKGNPPPNPFSPPPPTAGAVVSLPAPCLGRGGMDTTSPAPHPALPFVVVVHLHPCLFLLLQHVEDPGINIPDQTVIKKGKPFPCAYQTCRHRLGTTCREDLPGLPPPALPLPPATPRPRAPSSGMYCWPKGWRQGKKTGDAG